MVFNERLNEVAQALDEAVAHLLPTNPNQVPIQQDPTQDPLPHNNNEPDPDFPGEKSRTSPPSS